jgi:uncharacterized membrane protein
MKSVDQTDQVFFHFNVLCLSKNVLILCLFQIVDVLRCRIKEHLFRYLFLLYVAILLSIPIVNHSTSSVRSVVHKDEYLDSTAYFYCRVTLHPC